MYIYIYLYAFICIQMKLLYPRNGILGYMTAIFNNYDLIFNSGSFLTLCF